MKRRGKLGFVLLVLLLLCNPVRALFGQEASNTAQVREQARDGRYRLISPEEIRKRFLRHSESLFLVDTRQQWEYQREHIQGAVNLPITPTWWTQYSPWTRAEIRELLGPDRNRQVIFY